MDGVSITYGSPRQHVWTLAAGSGCPCNIHSSGTNVPSFVGEDYYCDDARRNSYLLEDRLWDEENCLTGAEQCCERANWFCNDLPQATTDDIELRVCVDQSRGDEDMYIEEVEIYVH